MQSLLEMRGICKRFPGVMALDGVDFSVAKGEIHSLIGQNGAGKSTLMKILAGTYRCDEGTIHMEGRPVTIGTAADAQKLGISIVYQELSLLPCLTVADNILLGQEPMRRMRIDKSAVYARSRQILADLGIGGVEAGERVENLPLAKQQLVEIAKALVREPKLLILDEPTAALTAADTERLFTILKKLTARGVAIVFITHRMKEIFRYCDRGTVLRNGRQVGVLDIAACTEEDLIRSMLGGGLEQFYRGESTVCASAENPAVEVENLQIADKVHGVSFCLYPGQITGLTGLLGAGQNEVARALFGAQEGVEAGTVRIGGEVVQIRSPGAAIRNGVGLLTENRKEEGLFLEMSVAENVAIASLEEMRAAPPLPLLSRRKIAERTKRYTDKVHVVMRSPRSRIRELSGGNQQKAIIARWLLRGPEVLVFLEPTRGVDIGAKAEIYRQLEALTKEGKCILVVSNDTAEILGISDTILVMYQGRLVGQFAHGVPEEELLGAVQGRGSTGAR